MLEYCPRQLGGRRYQLGLTVDSTDPESIAQGLQRFLYSPSELEKLWNGETMHQFATENTAKQFVKTLLRSIEKID